MLIIEKNYKKKVQQNEDILKQFAFTRHDIMLLAYLDYLKTFEIVNFYILDVDENIYARLNSLKI